MLIFAFESLQFLLTAKCYVQGTVSGESMTNISVYARYNRDDFAILPIL